MATGHSACSHKGSKSQKTPNSQHFLESPKISEMPASRFASWGCYIKVSKGCSRYIHINTHTQHDTHIWEMLIVLFPLSPFFRGRRQGRQPLYIYIYISHSIPTVVVLEHHKMPGLWFQHVSTWFNMFQHVSTCFNILAQKAGALWKRLSPVR